MSAQAVRMGNEGIKSVSGRTCNEGGGGGGGGGGGRHNIETERRRNGDRREAVAHMRPPLTHTYIKQRNGFGREHGGGRFIELEII